MELFLDFQLHTDTQHFPDEKLHKCVGRESVLPCRAPRQNLWIDESPTHLRQEFHSSPIVGLFMVALLSLFLVGRAFLTRAHPSERVRRTTDLSRKSSLKSWTANTKQSRNFSVGSFSTTFQFVFKGTQRGRNGIMHRTGNPLIESCFVSPCWLWSKLQVAHQLVCWINPYDEFISWCGESGSCDFIGVEIERIIVWENLENQEIRGRASYVTTARNIRLQRQPFLAHVPGTLQLCLYLEWLTCWTVIFRHFCLEEWMGHEGSPRKGARRCRSHRLSVVHQHISSSSDCSCVNKIPKSWQPSETSI